MASSLYILFKNNEPVHITRESPWTGTPVMKVIKNDKGEVVDYDNAKNYHNYTSFAEVQALAEWATKYTGEVYLACNDGSYFEVIEAPKVGDEVSRGFNGDYYYVGKIVRITPNWMVVAEDAEGHQTKFNRRKNTASWKPIGGYGGMVHGVVNRQNPEF